MVETDEEYDNTISFGEQGTDMTFMYVFHCVCNPKKD